MTTTIAITGMGLTTSLGCGLSRNWERLVSGATGIAPLKTIDVSNYPVTDGGEDPEPWVVTDRVDHVIPPELGHLISVCVEALAAAGAGKDTEWWLPFDPGRTGVAVGSSLAASTASQAFFRSLFDKGPTEARYELLRGYYVDDQMRLLLNELEISGPSILVSNACAAGASAIARGGDWIRSGRCDAVVAVGYDAFSIFTFAGFGSLMALSRERLRPFSARRDGMKLGGGYAALVLEPLDRALERNATPIALLSGYGESSDAHHLTHPHPEGLGARLAMERALSSASLGAGDIDAINCHATATPSNDAAEAAAMKSVFGDSLASIPICASKPAVGHTLGGAGAVEAVISVQSMISQHLPPTLNVEDVDEELGPLDLVSAGRDGPLRHVMSNSFGFGGSNASLIFSTHDNPSRDEEEGS